MPISTSPQQRVRPLASGEVEVRVAPQPQPVVPQLHRPPIESQEDPACRLATSIAPPSWDAPPSRPARTDSPPARGDRPPTRAVRPTLRSLRVASASPDRRFGGYRRPPRTRTQAGPRETGALSPSTRSTRKRASSSTRVLISRLTDLRSDLTGYLQYYNSRPGPHRAPYLRRHSGPDSRACRSVAAGDVDMSRTRCLVWGDGPRPASRGAGRGDCCGMVGVDAT